MRFLQYVSCCVCALLLGGCQSTFERAENPDLTSMAGDGLVLTWEPARLAREHFSRGEFGLAERYYREATENAPGQVKLWLGLAASYDQLRRFDLADRAYDKATELGGPTFQILNNRGYSYLLRGDLAPAAAMLERAKALRPDLPIVINNLELLRASEIHFRQRS